MPTKKRIQRPLHPRLKTGTQKTTGFARPAILPVHRPPAHRTLLPQLLQSFNLLYLPEILEITAAATLVLARPFATADKPLDAALEGEPTLPTIEAVSPRDETISKILMIMVTISSP
ncbi:hypothetical protein VIBNIFTn2_1110022 [Vibrio nigripulchritudo FTn2]|nr:hypothetical protein VIBNIFTn2_1110022 [Vibrio nigripulchritudo FTn2]